MDINILTSLEEITLKKTYVLNVPVNITSYDEIIDTISKKIKNNKKYSIVSINLNKVILANENNEIMKIIKSFDCFIPDGISVVKANDKIDDRITGIDLFNRICEDWNKIGAKIFLYGAKEEIVKTAKINLENKYKGIEIVGYENGYVKDNDMLIKKINETSANIVFIAMGSPRQEKWIYENRKLIKANILIGVGGTFDIVSGKLKRAPKWIRKLGIEWLYRMVKEPKRLKNVHLQIKYYFKLKKKGNKI